MNASHQNYLAVPGYPRQQCASLSVPSHTPRTHAQLDASSPYLSPSYLPTPYQAELAMFSNAHRASAPNQDSSYPSPTTSIPSPGSHASYQLEAYASYSNGAVLNHGASNDGSRMEFAQIEPSSGPTRGTRTRRQATVQQGILGRRGSVPSTSSRGEKDIPPRYHPSMHSASQAYPESRPHTPSSENSQELRLDLKTANVSYHPITPTSLASPYSPYEHHPTHSRSGSGSASVLDHRPVSPALSSGSVLTSASSGSATNVYPYPPFPIASSSKDNKGTGAREKHKKARLSNLDRKQICLYANGNPNKRQEDIASHFGVERSTISKILKNKEQWMKVDEGAQPVSKHRPTKFPQIEDAMVHWIRECDDNDTNMADIMIKDKAKEIARRCGITEERFKASSGWVDNFKHRYHISRGIWQKGKREHGHGDYTPSIAMKDSADPVDLPAHSPYDERMNEMSHSGSSHSSSNNSHIMDTAMHRVQDGVQIWRQRDDDISHSIHPSVHPPPAHDVSEGSSSHSPSVQRISESPISLPPLQHLDASHQRHEAPQHQHLEASQQHLEAPQQHLEVPQQHLEAAQPQEYHIQGIYDNVDTSMYPPEPPIPDHSLMTISEAEHALTRIITFIDLNPELSILRSDQREMLTEIKCAFFQVAGGQAPPAAL